MFGSDAAQQSLLKSLYRSQRHKRNIICEDYGDLLEECSKLKLEHLEKNKIEQKKELELVNLFEPTEYTFTDYN